MVLCRTCVKVGCHVTCFGIRSGGHPQRLHYTAQTIYTLGDYLNRLEMISESSVRVSSNVTVSVNGWHHDISVMLFVRSMLYSREKVR